MTFRKRRILAALLALALCLSLLPMSALAAEADALGETGPEEAVCTCTAPCTEGRHEHSLPGLRRRRGSTGGLRPIPAPGQRRSETRPLANGGSACWQIRPVQNTWMKKGQEQTCPSATEVTESDTTWGDDNNDGWYVVNSNVTISNRITVTDDVHLILVDGCNLADQRRYRRQQRQQPEYLRPIHGGGHGQTDSKCCLGEGSHRQRTIPSSR